MRLDERWRRTRADWALQSYYQRFESALALVLTAIVSLILDIEDTSAAHLFGLAAVTLGLGVTYWLIRQRDQHNAVSKGMGT